MTSSEGGPQAPATGAGAGAGSPEDLYVITENGEQCFLWRSNQLTYIAQNRHELPTILAIKFGHLATRLDLSYNSLTSFKNINSFTNLNELILDNNLLEDDQLNFEQNLRLKTLSLNKNKLANLCKLVNCIKVRLPNLEYLSLIGNPLCPGPLLRAPDSGDITTAAKEAACSSSNIDELVLATSNGPLNPLEPIVFTNISSEFSQQKYRHFIIYHLPNLRFLDSSPITPSERDEALRRCFWMSQASLSQLEEPTSTRPPHTSSFSQPPAVTRAHRPVSRSEDSASTAADDQQATDGQFRLTIMSGGNSLSGNNQTKDIAHTSEQPSAVYSRLAYKYTGRNSEGNRFIRNQDL